MLAEDITRVPLIPLQTVLGFGNIQLELYTRARRGEMERMPRENLHARIAGVGVEEFRGSYISH